MSGATYPSLAGRHVLVTGGGSGIGAAIVEGFARQGSQVSFVDILQPESHALAERLRSEGARVQFRACDLADLDAVQATIAGIERACGAVQVLVNNAANDDRHSLEQITPAYWDDRMAVNLRHMLFCAKAVAPGMRSGGGGAIVNLGSISWHLALPDLVLYETAKGGIEGMTRALARDLGTDGIRVNCVVPGGVRTERQMRLWHNPQEEARMVAQQCLKARVEPRDVAAMVLFLASDDARMCTAHNYFVDAGWR